MAKKTPQQLDAEGRCIVCEKVENGRKRGLCRIDYGRYRRAKDSIAEEERDDFDRSLVGKGLLLPSRQGGRIEDDPFNIALEEFRAAATGESPETGNTPLVRKVLNEAVSAEQKERQKLAAPDEPSKQARPRAKK